MPLSRRFRRFCPGIALAVVVALCLTSGTAAAQTPGAAPRAVRVPPPDSVIGFAPGTDRKLPTWAQVVEYMRRLDAASPRVTVRTLGGTTLGRPFIAVYIADSAVLARLPRYREVQRKLADPRVQARGERDRLVRQGKAVALITSSIHSNEVGGFMSPLVLAHRLATAEDAEARMVRDSVITILVPSLNPDGVDLVGDWYRATVGTPSEGEGEPFLYHHYTGHDNNRDWYAFTQVETRLTIDSLHNVWHPHAVNDIHQQGPRGSRLFLPPYLAPVEPNVDPLLMRAVDSLGRAMARRLVADGRQGVVTDAIYDAWTPARAYQHYHGGARILTETASARLASPIDVPFDSLQRGRGYDARLVSPNFPVVWPGGRWTIGDIVSYQAAGAWAMLLEVAHARTLWLDRFATLGERAVAGRHSGSRDARHPERSDAGHPERSEGWPWAYVIPATQRDAAATRTLLRTLQRGDVEVRRATRAFTAAGARYPANSWVIPLAQPYGSFAKALLERQQYPDLRDSSGNPTRPYDVTAHTLPLLMGVTATAIVDSQRLQLSRPIAMLPAPRLTARGLTNERLRITRPTPVVGTGATGMAASGVALYRNGDPSMDEGWTRWLLDQHGIPFRTLNHHVLRDSAALRASARVLILPDQSARALREGASAPAYPDSLAGGLGAAGAASLRAFVEGGGTIVAFNSASRYLIDVLALPVRDALAGVPASSFYGPGALLRMTVDTTHPVASGSAPDLAGWYEMGPAFEFRDSTSVRAIATWANADGGTSPLLSGWLLGGDRLSGRAAIVEVRVGQGRVILFGMRPQYRGQSMATYPLVWGALRGR